MKVHTLAIQECKNSNIVTTPQHLPLPLDENIVDFIRSNVDESQGRQLVSLAPRVLELLEKWGLLR